MATYLVMPSSTAGDANDLFTQNNYLPVEMTEAELQTAYNDSKQLQQAFGDFDNYMGYIEASQDMVTGADWYNATVTASDYPRGSDMWYYLMGEDKGWSPGQLEQLRLQEIQDNKNARKSAYYQWMNENQQLLDDFGVERVIYNQDGDQYTWTGSGYQKTYKVDDHASFSDYAIALTKTAVAAGLAYGISPWMPSELTGLFEAAGMSSGGAQAAASALLTNGVQQAASGDFDAGALIVSSMAAGYGQTLAGLTNLPAAAQATIAGSLASTFEQAVQNGELDFATIMQSGLLSGGTTILSDIVNGAITGEPITFGGLVDPNSAFGTAVNDLRNDIAGSLEGLMEQYVYGGEFFDSVDGNYDLQLSTQTDSSGNRIFYATDRTTGDIVAQGTLDNLANRGYVYIKASENPLWSIITSSFGSLDDGLNYITDKFYEGKTWYEVLDDYLKEQGGSVSGESGSTLSTESTDPNSGGGGGGGTQENPDCTAQNRATNPDGTCGACLDGFQSNNFAECVEIVDKTCPSGQVWNEVLGGCEDEEFFEEGAPCTADGGEQGTFDANGDCIVATPGGGGGGTGGEGTGSTEPTGNVIRPSFGCASGYEDENGTCYPPDHPALPGNQPTEPEEPWDGTCPEGSEVKDPEYDFYDLNKAGTYNYGGTRYSYDPCNPSQPHVNEGPASEELTPEEECIQSAGPGETKVYSQTNGCVVVGSGCGSQEGFIHDENGDCVQDPNYTPPADVADCASQNRVENGDGTCGGCITGHYEFQGECIEALELSCRNQNRYTHDDGTCGECFPGYRESGDRCVSSGTLPAYVCVDKGGIYQPDNPESDEFGCIYPYGSKAYKCEQKGGTYDPNGENPDEDGCVFEPVTPPEEPQGPQDGDPCTTEDGQEGTFDEETGGCIVTVVPPEDPTEPTGPQDGDDCTTEDGQAGTFDEETGECIVTTAPPETPPGGSAEDCPEGQTWNEDKGECEVVTTGPGDGGGGGGGGGLLGGFSSIGQTEFTGIGSPTGGQAGLLNRAQFPITDYLTSLFTNQRIK